MLGVCITSLAGSVFGVGTVVRSIRVTSRTARHAKMAGPRHAKGMY